MTQVNSMLFKELSEQIDPSILSILDSLGFTEATAVQEKVIPEFVRNDVVVQSQTGSGKTLSYLIPLVNKILQIHKQQISENISIAGLIIVPTRELSLQIEEILVKFPVKACSFIGGMPIEKDIKKLSQVDVVIATPGRLFEILSEKSQCEKFKKISYLILDEADKMVTLGFEAKVIKILEYLPKNRLAGLFSATIDESVMKICSMSNPKIIKITENIPEKLNLKWCVLSPVEKYDAMWHLISKHSKIIVFFNTCNMVDFFYESMVKIKTADCSKVVHKIHGKMDQRIRNTVYSAFEESGGILLCTDVAARGIDFKGIEMVVHFDVPKDYNNIVHRSGRTARMGNEGESIIFLMENEKSMVEFLKLKGIHCNSVELSCDVNFHSILADAVKKDKSLLDLSVKGFVSYIRAYKEHILNYILNYKELDYDGLAELHCLERIPKMAELKNIKFQKYERKQQQ